MANVKISGLPTASTPLTGAELVPVVQSGVTSQTTLSAMPYVPTGTGAVTTTVQAKLRETVSVKDFGAVGDGVTDDTAAIQAAISSLGTVGGTVNFPTDTYLISSPILVPTKIILEGNNSILTGAGTKINDCFHTAYYVGGVLTDLVGTTYGTAYLQQTKITNFRFTNFDICVHAVGLTSMCEISYCRFAYSKRAVYVEEGYFLSLRHLRADYIQNSLPAFQFVPLNGQIYFENLACTSCDIAYKFQSTCQATAIKSLDAESCTTGIQFQGIINGVEISGCYFENITGTAIDFSTNSPQVYNSKVHNNFFNVVGLGVDLRNITASNVKVEDNYWDTSIGYQISFSTTAAQNYNVIDNGFSHYKNNLDFPPAGTIAGTALSQYPVNANTKWNLIKKYVNSYSTASGNLLARASDYQGTIIPFTYYGDIGFNNSNNIPFCTAVTANVVGVNFDIKVKTAITYRTYLTTVFSVTLTDNVGSYTINGRTYGTTVILDTAAGKTCTAIAEADGTISLQFSSFSHPTNVFTYTGIVKII